MRIEIKGEVHEFDKGITLEEVFKALNLDLSKIIAAKVDGKAVDLSYVLDNDATVEPIDIVSEEGEEILRHSTSHILAQAVIHLFPDVKYTIGPAIENGFYYDFDLDTPLTESDLSKIEEEMRHIVDAGYKFEREVLKKSDAIELFKRLNQPYKIELIEEIPDEEIVDKKNYQIGQLTHFCLSF